jgi:hypothetical protein
LNKTSNTFGKINHHANYVQMSLIARPLRKRGPPATGKGLLVGVRLQPPQLSALDAWINDQPKKMSRPEAVRQILAKALGEK